MKSINNSGKWFLNKSPATHECLRIFAFPYAGGGATVYKNWEAAFPDFVGLYPVQLPGRENRFEENLFQDIPSLISAVSDAISPVLDIPFILFGHSLGAKIAFELARELRRKWGISPCCLIVSGSRAPNIPEPKPISHLPDRTFLKELGRFSGICDAVLQNKELMEMYLPLLRADFIMEETYVFSEDLPLECPVIAFGGTEDSETKLDELAAWADHTAAWFSLEMIKGDHFFIQKKKAQLLVSINKDLLNFLPQSNSEGPLSF